MESPIVKPLRKNWLRSEGLWAFLLLIPLFIGLFLIYFSVVFGFLMSFANWDMVSKPDWIGGSNYQAIANDPLFWKSMKNTLYLILLSVPAKIIIGLLLALLLNQKLRGIEFFKLAFFFPTACSVVAIALLWGYMYDNSGLLNTLLQQFGFEQVYWMEVDTALGSIAIMSIWSGLGYIALLYLAGLQNIPTEYYEASRVDGASKFQQFHKITVPLLTPTTFFVLVILLIGTFQTFGEVYILEGPLDSTLTIVQHIFTEAFASFRMGYASALSYILIFIILVITLIQLYFQKKWVNYDL